MLGRLFLAAIMLAFLEIYTLLRVYDELHSHLPPFESVLIILATLLLSASLGTQIAKRQGLKMLRAARESMGQGKVPDAPLLEGLMLLLAAIAFIIPGYVSDGFGLILLIPAVRRLFVRRWRLSLTSGFASGGMSGAVYWSSSHRRAPAHEPPIEVIDVEPRRLE